MKTFTSKFGGNKVMFMAAAILLLAAGCSKSATVQSGASITTQPTPTASMPSTTPPPPTSTSLKSLMMSSIAQKCTVNFSQNSTQSQGTIYLGQGEMRGDFTAQVNGKTETSHMINDGKMVYVWVDGSAMAMEMPVSASASATSSSQSQGIDPNANYQYSCLPWIIDSSVFKLPAGVKFDSMSSMTGSTTGAAAADSGSVNPSASANATLKAQECESCNAEGPVRPNAWPYCIAKTAET